MKVDEGIPTKPEYVVLTYYYCLVHYYINTISRYLYFHVFIFILTSSQKAECILEESIRASHTCTALMN